jgi:hypothetical protein
MPDRDMEQVERVARAIYEDCYPSLRWSDAIKDPRMEDVVRMCRSNARAALAAADAETIRAAERREFLNAIQRISLGFMEHTHGDEQLESVDATVQGICSALERWVTKRGEEKRDV